MIRYLCACGFFFSFFCAGQPSFHLNSAVGLNRIGVLFDLAGQVTVKNHNAELGLRFYGPDQVFVHAFPGLFLGYTVCLPSERKVGAFVGLNSSFFHEKKDQIRVTLIDPKFTSGVNWKWSKRFSSCVAASIGYVFTTAKGGFVTPKSTFMYLNYEFKMGISYRLSH